MTTAERHDLTLLRSALRETTGDPEIDEFVQASLFAGIAKDPEAVRVFREETAPEQVVVDLHLEGGEVTEHSTNAGRFARFVQRISQATSAVAKDVAGAARYPENLLIDALAPGSVRVVLRAPGIPTDKGRPAFEDLPVSTADSTALRRIAGILTHASTTSDAADDELLPALVRELPARARSLLESASTEMLKAGWEVAGTVRQRRYSEEDVTVTQRGVARLKSVLKFAPSDPARESIVGTIDGFKYSLGVIYFSPADSRRGFSAVVHTDALLVRVVRLSQQKDLDVVATFEIVTEGGAEDSVRVYRTLVDVREAGAQGKLGV
ncbi:hypothetical protein ACFWEJ_08215 [Promicromonospora sp. NPDC060204]|uniref:hypothetical protein n=1 Tax=Promicromonospora sp. NPDC060204 TaxID=3347071 RepID=UPI003654B9CB